ncbi:MAG TPA: hypothetical protein VF611_17675, partial [Pyrinomonadaceae bacterium]
MYTHESNIPFAVYAYATSVLARGTAAARRGGRMTREEAESLLRAVVGGDSGAPLLGAGDVAGVMLGAAELFFRYDAGRGALACGALVYRFRSAPRPGVLEAFFEEASAAAADAGSLAYHEETRALLLARTYY